MKGQRIGNRVSPNVQIENSQNILVQNYLQECQPYPLYDEKIFTRSKFSDLQNSQNNSLSCWHFRVPISKKNNLEQIKNEDETKNKKQPLAINFGGQHGYVETYNKNFEMQQAKSSTTLKKPGKTPKSLVRLSSQMRGNKSQEQKGLGGVYYPQSPRKTKIYSQKPLSNIQRTFNWIGIKANRRRSQKLNQRREARDDQKQNAGDSWMRKVSSNLRFNIVSTVQQLNHERKNKDLVMGKQRVRSLFCFNQRISKRVTSLKQSKVNKNNPNSYAIKGVKIKQGHKRGFFSTSISRKKLRNTIQEGYQFQRNQKGNRINCQKVMKVEVLRDQPGRIKTWKQVFQEKKGLPPLSTHLKLNRSHKKDQQKPIQKTRVRVQDLNLFRQLLRL